MILLNTYLCMIYVRITWISFKGDLIDETKSLIRKRTKIKMNQTDLTIAYFDAPRFESGHPAAYRYLAEFGFVVIKDVIKNSQIEQLQNKFWELIARYNPKISRTDINTWSSAVWPGRHSNGMIGDCGQSDFMWGSRLATKHVFVDLFKSLKENGIIPSTTNCEKLLTSFDSCNAMRSSEQIDWRTVSNWFHVDYDPEHPICYQGFLNLIDSTKNHGGLLVIPKSHLHIDQFFAQDLGKMPEKYPDYLPKRSFKINCCAGDFVLWDHRLIHCNTNAIVPKPNSKDKFGYVLERLVAYVCMIPLDLVPESDREQLLARRRIGSLCGDSTGHSPYKYENRGRSYNPAPEILDLIS